MDLQLDKNYISNTLDQLWTRSQGKGAQSTLLSKYKWIADHLDALYSGVDNYGAKAWLFVNDHQSPPTCYCGKIKNWKSYSRGFGDYCSIKCMSNCAKTRDKRAATISAKYGVDHFSKSTEYKNKFKQTCFDRYGVINPGQIPKLKLQRAKNKSFTYLSHLINSVADNYVPLFDINAYGGVHEPSNWLCKKCDNKFEMPNLIKGLVCISCYPRPKNIGESKQEIELREWIQSLGVNTVQKDRKVLQGKELDILIPDYDLAIEVCGSYWHSDQHVDRNYHQNKFLGCEQSNIQLLTLFDFDLKNLDLVQSMILHKLRLSPHKPLRPSLGKIIPIKGDQARRFNQTYHLRGHSAASYHFGLVFDNELVAVSSWGRNRFDKKSQSLELVRLCASRPVNGLLGKMTAHAARTLGVSHIQSYVDLRYGTGMAYRSAGYQLVKTTSPGYWYVDSATVCYHRSSFSKQKLKNFTEYDVNKTEFEIMNELNYNRIWDCGNRLFEWKA